MAWAQAQSCCLAVGVIPCSLSHQSPETTVKGEQWLSCVWEVVVWHSRVPEPRALAWATFLTPGNAVSTHTCSTSLPCSFHGTERVRRPGGCVQPAGPIWAHGPRAQGRFPWRVPMAPLGPNSGERQRPRECQVGAALENELCAAPGSSLLAVGWTPAGQSPGHLLPG